MCFVFLLKLTHYSFARFGNYVNKQDARKFVLAVLLNYDIDGNIGIYLQESQLEYAQIQFLNQVVNAQGEVHQTFSAVIIVIFNQFIQAIEWKLFY
jgi:hypothetical protein